MAESFLEEQLKRIREMTEQMSRVQNQANEWRSYSQARHEIPDRPKPHNGMRGHAGRGSSRRRHR